MDTMTHFDRTRDAVRLVGGLCLLMAIFAVVGEMDYQDARHLEALREERAASLAASVCLPRPGQRTVWQWQQDDGGEARLRCVVFDLGADPARPRVVMDASPAGLDRLALWAGSQK